MNGGVENDLHFRHDSQINEQVRGQSKLYVRI